MKLALETEYQSTCNANNESARSIHAPCTEQQQVPLIHHVTRTMKVHAPSMLLAPKTMEKLIRKSLQLLHRVLYVHFSIFVAMVIIGSVAVEYSKGSSGTTSVPYFFSIFISAIWHLVSLVLAVVCIRILKDTAEKRRQAPKWMMAYSLCGSVIVLWEVMGIVFTVVNGICNSGQLCYYDRNVGVNRGMAICIIFLHSLSMVISTFLARKTHLYEVEFGNDISIKLGHEWVLSRRASVATVTSTGSFHSSRSLDSMNDIQDNEQDKTKAKTPAPVGKTKTIVVIEMSTAKKRTISAGTERSKSIPNIRKHPEMIENQPDLRGGTKVSIYADSDTKETDGKKSGKGHRRSKSESESAKRTRLFAEQVASNVKENLDGLETRRSQIAPLPDLDAVSDVVELKGANNDTDELVKTDDKNKQKKKKKQKKSKISPNEVKETGQHDTVKAWGKTAKGNEEGAGALLERQQKLQQDQATLQKQQTELFLKQQEMLERQQEQMGILPQPQPPNYEEAINRDNSILPNQTAGKQESEA